MFPLLAGAFLALGIATGQGPLSFALTSFVPLLWAWCPSWRHAWAGMTIYYAATSWTVIPSYTEYLELGTSGIFSASCVWLLAAILSSSPWAFLFRSDRRWTFIRLLLIAILTTAPPLGLFQWMNPFLGLAFLSPLYGWVGIVAGMVMLTYIIHHPTTLWIIPAMALLFTGWAKDNGEGLPGWGAVDTRHVIKEDFDGFSRTFTTLRKAGNEAATRKLKVAVLGESVGGRDHEGAGFALGHSKRTTFLVGGSQIVGGKTEAQLWVYPRSEKTRSTIYRQRIPAPVVSGLMPSLSMPSIIEVDGLKVAPFICYEGLTAWALVSAIWHRPDALVLITNTSWSSIDVFINAQLRSHVETWGKLFGIPTLVASNRLP